MAEPRISVIILLLAAASIFFDIPGAVTARTEITNIETEGNLQSTHELGCISLKQAKNNYTPVALYKAAARCINEEKYEEGAEIYALAGTYGFFDKLRVTDKTAHQAIQVLILSNMNPLDRQKKEQWKLYLDKLTEKDSANFKQLCNAVQMIGPPDYYPSYMIQHGMAAVLNASTQPIVDDFDVKTSWKAALDKYLHCT